jgi:hypothetical protein
VDVKELTSKADSVTVCLSKGLGAPAGSLLAGSKPFVEKVGSVRVSEINTPCALTEVMFAGEQARKLRKALGGAMRQASPARVNDPRRDLMRASLGQVGILAAAGLVALKRTLPRLADDHDNAQRLAAGVAAIPGLMVCLRAQ